MPNGVKKHLRLEPDPDIARAQTTELDISDVLPRGREHKERRERLELAASEARTALESIADSDSGSWEQLEDACRELQAKA